MKIEGVISMLLAVLLLSSCCTPALWEATNPNEYVALPAHRVSENELKAKGLRRYKAESQDLFSNAELRFDKTIHKKREMAVREDRELYKVRPAKKRLEEIGRQPAELDNQ